MRICCSRPAYSSWIGVSSSKHVLEVAELGFMVIDVEQAQPKDGVFD
jgi:hypothetical protein